jgi:hypothetical protein
MKLNMLRLIDVCQAREHSGQVRGPTTGEMEATRKVRVTTNATRNNLIEGQFRVSISIVRDDAGGPIVRSRDRIGQMPKVGQARDDIDASGNGMLDLWLVLLS